MSANSEEELAKLAKAIAPLPRGSQLSPQRARARQVFALARVIMLCDRMLLEAAENNVPAPGFLDIRGWASTSILELATEAQGGAQ